MDEGVRALTRGVLPQSLIFLIFTVPPAWSMAPWQNTTRGEPSATTLKPDRPRDTTRIP